MQTTLIILKPDCVQRGLMGEVIARLERKGLSVVGAKFIMVPKEIAEQHHRVCDQLAGVGAGH